MYLPHKLAGDCTPPEEKLSSLEKAVRHAQALIGARALTRIGHSLGVELHNAGVLEFHIFGGACLRGTPNDLDLAPAKRSGDKFTALARALRPTMVSQFGQKVYDGVKAQFCLVPASSLQELVDGFDFAHCRVGATLTKPRLRADEPWTVKEVYLAPPFIAAMLAQGTFYAGGQWPYRSLARVAKVGLKLGLSQDEVHALALQILAQLHEVGFDEAGKDDPRFLEWVLGKSRQDVLPED